MISIYDRSGRTCPHAFFRRRAGRYRPARLVPPFLSAPAEKRTHYKKGGTCNRFILGFLAALGRSRLRYAPLFVMALASRASHSLGRNFLQLYGARKRPHSLQKTAFYITSCYSPPAHKRGGWPITMLCKTPPTLTAYQNAKCAQK